MVRGDGCVWVHRVISIDRDLSARLRAQGGERDDHTPSELRPDECRHSAPPACKARVVSWKGAYSITADQGIRRRWSRGIAQGGSWWAYARARRWRTARRVAGTGHKPGATTILHAPRSGPD